MNKLSGDKKRVAQKVPESRLLKVREAARVNSSSSFRLEYVIISVDDVEVSFTPGSAIYP